MNKQTTIEQVVAAPRERVFRAFIDPKDVMSWFFASEGWTTPHAEIDAREGGRFSIGFQSPDGQGSFDFTGTYTELKEPERISYMIDKDIADTKDEGRPVTTIFEDLGDGTTKVTQTFMLESTNSEEIQREGWGAMLKNLAKHLEK